MINSTCHHGLAEHKVQKTRAKSVSRRGVLLPAAELFARPMQSTPMSSSISA